MDILIISSNSNPHSKDYDERGVGIYRVNGVLTAVVLRTYY